LAHLVADLNVSIYAMIVGRWAAVHWVRQLRTEASIGCRGRRLAMRSLPMSSAALADRSAGMN